VKNTRKLPKDQKESAENVEYDGFFRDFLRQEIVKIQTNEIFIYVVHTNH